MSKRDEILKALKENGEDWVIAALIDGSIGYHTPTHARRLIEDVKNEETFDACERCLACFKGDLLEMVSHDIRCFALMSPSRRERLISSVRQFDKLTPVQEMTFSLMYPTAGV